MLATARQRRGYYYACFIQEFEPVQRRQFAFFARQNTAGETAIIHPRHLFFRAVVRSCIICIHTNVAGFANLPVGSKRAKPPEACRRAQFFH